MVSPSVTEVAAGDGLRAATSTARWRRTPSTRTGWSRAPPTRAGRPRWWRRSTGRTSPTASTSAPGGAGHRRRRDRPGRGRGTSVTSTPTSGPPTSRRRAGRRPRARHHQRADIRARREVRGQRRPGAGDAARGAGRGRTARGCRSVAIDRRDVSRATRSMSDDWSGRLGQVLHHLRAGQRAQRRARQRDLAVPYARSDDHVRGGDHPRVDQDRPLGSAARSG